MNQTSKSDQERLVEAEIALTHLQRDYESLNEVVLGQQRAIKTLSGELAKLQAKLNSSSDPEVRDAESERPPHY